MSQSVFEDVRKFVAEKCGMKIEAVVETTEFQATGAFAMDVHDAYEFFNAFSEEFKVEMTEFQLERHFPSEAYFLPLNLLRRWLSKEKPQFIPISVSDLSKAARENKWPAEMYI